MTTITIPGKPGTLTEDKQEASRIRKSLLLPALDRGESVIIDFASVDDVTQSFIHSLIGEPLVKYGEQLLDRVEFHHCVPRVRTMIELVVDYSLAPA